VTAEKFIGDWLDKVIWRVFKDTYAGEQQRWKRGRPEGEIAREPAVSVEAVEFQLTDEQDSTDDPRRLFSNLADEQRTRLVYEALKRLVDIGKAIRLRSPEDEIADQLFRPSNLLEALATAAQ